MCSAADLLSTSAFGFNTLIDIIKRFLLPGVRKSTWSKKVKDLNGAAIEKINRKESNEEYEDGTGVVSWVKGGKGEGFRAFWKGFFSSHV